ncbi:hypothetical protein [Chryseobacterium contaminans]|uniref:hypothetical protein n=1 Tax=Chryseobacterium contaminans TaxID=1423959 RepID=UPI0030188AE1
MGKEENISEKDKDARVFSFDVILEINSTLIELLDISNGSHAHRQGKNEWSVEKYE